MNKVTVSKIVPPTTRLSDMNYGDYAVILKHDEMPEVEGKLVIRAKAHGWFFIDSGGWFAAESDIKDIEYNPLVRILAKGEGFTVEIK